MMVLQMKVGLRPFEAGSADYLLVWAALPVAAACEAVPGFSEDCLQMTSISHYHSIKLLNDTGLVTS